MRTSLLAMLLPLSACAEGEGPAALDVRLDPHAAVLELEPEPAPGFHFLPPLAPQSSATGEFDPSLLEHVAVEICRLDACDGTLARFTASSGSGSERVRLDVESERYIVNWHTAEFPVRAGERYRIIVRVAGTALGHVDVLLVSQGSGSNGSGSDEVAQVKEGRTVPIGFRIEQGKVTVVGSAGGVVLAPTGEAELVVPAGALTDDVGITAEAVEPAVAGVVPGTSFDFEPEGLVFSEPAELVLHYDPAALPSGTDPVWLRAHQVVDGSLEELAGSSADVGAAAVRAPVRHFSTFTVAATSPLAWTIGQISPNLIPGGVWVVSATDVFAVGGDRITRGGAIFRYDGSTWSEVFTSPDWLGGVWGFGPSDVFVVGDRGAILHLDGAAWTPMASPVANSWLGRVWGSGPADVYACGWDFDAGTGLIIHYDGSAWSTVFRPDFQCEDLWGTGSADVYVVGRRGPGREGESILHYDGTGWRLQSHPDFGFFFGGGIWGASPSDIVVVGDFPDCTGHGVLRYDGASWEIEPFVARTVRPGKVWGMSSSEIYVVPTDDPCNWNDGTEMFRYDGTAWIREVVVADPIIRWLDIHGVAPEAVFAVGLKSLQGGLVMMGTR